MGVLAKAARRYLLPVVGLVIDGGLICENEIGSVVRPGGGVAERTKTVVMEKEVLLEIPFDQDLMARVRRVPNAKWDRERRVWCAPECSETRAAIAQEELTDRIVEGAVAKAAAASAKAAAFARTRQLAASAPAPRTRCGSAGARGGTGPAAIRLQYPEGLRRLFQAVSPVPG